MLRSSCVFWLSSILRCAVFGYRKASGLGVDVVVPVEKNV